MKISESVLSQARDLNHPAVIELLRFYENVIKNNAYDAYIIRTMYERNWNKELLEKEVELVNTGKNAEVHDKAVDRTQKHFDGQVKFLNDTEAIRKMLTSDELERSVTDKRLNGKDIALP